MCIRKGCRVSINIDYDRGFARMTRQENLKFLLEWAKDKPLQGIESEVRQEALRRYHCTVITARSYATAVRMMLEEARAVAAV